MRWTFALKHAIVLATLGLVPVLALVACEKQPSGTASQSALRIGAVLPLTGDAAAYGESARKGIDLALEQITASRAADAPKITVVYEDSQGSPTKAVSALRKLITADKVPAVIGDLLSSNTLAMAPVANENKVVLLSPASSAPAITNSGEYIFRNCPSDTLQGSLMADYARDRLKLDTVGIIYVNNDYGIGIRAVFTKAFTQNGGKIVADEAYPQDASNFRSQLAKIKGANPQAVYLIGYREVGTLLKQATELGLRTRYFSTILFEDPQILEIGGAATEGVVYTALAYDTKQSDPVVQAFVKAYRERHHSDPDIFAALSYDALKILAACADTSSTADQIKAQLYATKGFAGVTGTLSFDSNGDVAVPGRLKTVRDGQFVDFKE